MYVCIYVCHFTRLNNNIILNLFSSDASKPKKRNRIEPVELITCLSVCVCVLVDWLVGNWLVCLQNKYSHTGSVPTSTTDNVKVMTD